MEVPGRSVTLGVDTHEDEHVAVALDPIGRRLREAAFPAEGRLPAALAVG